MGKIKELWFNIHYYFFIFIILAFITPQLQLISPVTWCWEERSHSLKNSRVHYSELKKSFSSFSRRRFAAVHAMIWIWGGVLASRILFLFALFIAAFLFCFSLYVLFPFFQCENSPDNSRGSEIVRTKTADFKLRVSVLELREEDIWRPLCLLQFENWFMFDLNFFLTFSIHGKYFHPK